VTALGGRGRWDVAPLSLKNGGAPPRPADTLPGCGVLSCDLAKMGQIGPENLQTRIGDKMA